MSGPEHHFDLAIVGAGVSGLCLAQALLDAGNWSILLVDGANDDERLKTNSFWSEGPTALEALVRHRWKSLALVGADHRAHTVALERHTYQTLYFADLQRAVKARLTADTRHLIVNGLATSIQADDRRAQLTVAHQTFTADVVFDSRFHAAGLGVDTRRFHLLWQRFHGLVVRTAEPAFDPGTATFIDFRVELPAGTGFAYLLPSSPREALVELVSVGALNDGAAIIRAYLERCHGVRGVEVLNEEGGASPMTDQPFEPFDGPRVRRIGIPAGLLKPSTGYALTRILEDSQRLVASLRASSPPTARPPVRPLYRFLDGVFLELWLTSPQTVPAVFAALFTRVPPDRVLRFLDERASLLELATLVIRLPVWPFVRALRSWLTRRWRRPRVTDAPR